MKIAIHKRIGSFSDRWITYCKSNNLDYLEVNCYNSNIIEQLKIESVTHLMWHFSHESFKDKMVFNYVLNAADKMGIKTFPNFNTRFHFDDKIAQKYLFESVSAPTAKSFAFYESFEAKEFIAQVKLPVVAKLKGGAGSTNVKLLETLVDSNKYIDKLFSTGIKATAKTFENFDQKYRVAKKIKDPLLLFKKFIGFLKKNRINRMFSANEKGYVYFQEFLPNNTYDTRIIVVGGKAFGIIRYNKAEDFRASGSGKIDYDYRKIDAKMVEIAFDVTKMIGAQCLAFDFVYDKVGNPKIIEICYAFSMLAYDNCEGYWDKDMNFVKGKFNPQVFMIQDFINC